jgi:uncharacterized protein
MELSELDGFLAALIVGPELIMPNVWVPLIWGGDNPSFEITREAKQAVRTVMRRYDEIVRLVEQRPEAYAPIFRRGQDESVSAEGWASGFLAGMRLNRAAWEPLADGKDESVLLGPILSQLDDENGTLASMFEPRQLRVARELSADLIARAVIDVHRYWQARCRKQVQHQTKIRNAPCPCGSGRKHKHCCSAK